MGALADRERSSRCDCDKKERSICKDGCCDSKPCKKNCTADELYRAYDTCLAFEQVIDATGLPRSSDDKPKGICGRFKICFAQDLSSATYELTIHGDNSLKNNAEPVGAFLYLGNPSTPLNSSNIIIPLAGLDKEGNGCEKPTSPTCKIKTSSEFCCQGTITNDDVRNTVGTVANLFFRITAAAPDGIFVSVNGSNACEGASTQYGQDTGGLLRGQLDL